MPGIVLVVIGAGIMAYAGYTFAMRQMAIRKDKTDPNVPQRDETWAKVETRKAVMRLVIIDAAATLILLIGILRMVEQG